MADPNNDDTTLTIVRVFEAPRQLVWNAWTDPEQVAAWFGPEGFSTRVEQQDLREGGRSRYVMIGPDGAEYPCEGTFLEIVEGEKIVTTDEFGEDFIERHEGDLPQGMVTTALFEELGDRTRLTLTVKHPTREDRQKHEDMGVVAGWRSSFHCLDRLLEEGPAGEEDRAFVISRLIDAPRELVYDAYVDTANITHWWGPVGFTTTTHSADVRPDGEWRFTMHGPDGRDYENLIVYRELSRPERLCYEHPDSRQGEPVCFWTSVTFADEGGKTRVSMKMVFPTTAERDRVGIEYGAVDGGQDTLLRLSQRVGEAGAPDRLSLAIVSDTEVRFRRIVDAPIDVVYDAFTDPEKLKQWWGPRRTTLEVVEHDFRVGGKWRFICHEPDGSVHPFCGEIRAIEPGLKIEQTFTYDVEPFNQTPSIESVTFSQRDGKTVIKGSSVYPSRAARDGHLHSGMEGGMAESYDRLAELVTGTAILS